MTNHDFGSFKFLISLARSDGFEPPTLRFEVGGAPAQYLLVHRRDADDLTEEVHHLLGPRQTAEITVNDNAIEAVIDKHQKIAELPWLDERLYIGTMTAMRHSASPPPRKT